MGLEHGGYQTVKTGDQIAGTGGGQVLGTSAFSSMIALHK
jgi:hypothetical protein